MGLRHDHGPDGTDYQEWITWREIVPPERIALVHGESRDDQNAFESVLTHTKRDPWGRPGGTTFHFVNDGVGTALDRAREAAGARDVRIAGGGATILEYVNAGLVDEFTVALSPVLFGSGIRLFEGGGRGPRGPGAGRVDPSQRATHLTYAVRKR